MTSYCGLIAWTLCSYNVSILRRSQNKVHIPGIDICTSDASAREWRVSTHCLCGSHTAFPPSFGDVDRLTFRCGGQRQFRCPRLANCRSGCPSTLLDSSCYSSADTQDGNVDVMGDESAGKDLVRRASRMTEKEKRGVESGNLNPSSFLNWYKALKTGQWL